MRGVPNAVVAEVANFLYVTVINALTIHQTLKVIIEVAARACACIHCSKDTKDRLRSRSSMTDIQRHSALYHKYTEAFLFQIRAFGFVDVFQHFAYVVSNVRMDLCARTSCFEYGADGHVSGMLDRFLPHAICSHLCLTDLLTITSDTNLDICYSATRSMHATLTNFARNDRCTFKGFSADSAIGERV